MSDSDSDGSDLFGSTEKKQRHFMPDPKDYSPPVVSEQWHEDALTRVPEIFATKLGPNEVASMIDLLYLKHEHQRALDLCNEWLRLNSQRPKPLQANEILDVAARCAWKLGRNQEALDFILKSPTTRIDPGLQFLKGQLYAANGKLEESLIEFQSYLKQRTNDYLAWKEIAVAFTPELFTALPPQPTPVPNTNNPTNNQRLLWSYFTLRWSKLLFQRSPQPDTPISQRHKTTEAAAMDRALVYHVTVLGGGGDLPEQEAAKRQLMEEDTLGLGAELLAWLSVVLKADASEVEIDGDEKDKAFN